MKERPILFSGEMVRAILDGRKTQTRRPIKPQPNLAGGWFPSESHRNAVHYGSLDHLRRGIVKDFSPFGQPGDRLWVRETFGIDHIELISGRLPKTKPPLIENEIATMYYRADGECCQQIPECQHDNGPFPWRPSIHMPRWASRIVLEIIDIRAEQVQDITPEDTKKEGCPASGGSVGWFKSLWGETYGPESWAENPWVWVIDFKVKDIKKS